MIPGAMNFLTNSTLSSISQSTAASVSVETAMKAVGRPSSIMLDGKLDAKTKRYAAIKEFLYQAICFATYIALVIPLFKCGSFKLAQKFMKQEPGFQKFKNAGQFLEYKKIASMAKKERSAALSKSKFKNSFSKEINKELKKEKPNPFNVVKGAIELGNLVGSVLGLAIFAPMLSHHLIHPTLKFLGFEKKEPSDQK